MTGPRVPRRSDRVLQGLHSRWAEHRRRVLLLLRFGITGGSGFVVDTAVVYAARHETGPYLAGLISYLVAATFTWSMNRHWTFRHRPRSPLGRQWALFMASNLPGLLLNRGCYVLLIAQFALCRHNPVLATAGGAIAGMGANFMASHRLVFR